MKQLHKILRKYFNIRNLVICTMILSTQMSMGQKTDPQKEDLVLADTLLAAYGGNPMEAGNIIADIVPKKAVFDVGFGPKYFDWKDRVYDKIGLRFGVSYQMASEWASEVKPEAAHDNALSDWWGFMIKWTLINRNKKKNQGHLVFSMFQRYPIGNNQIPSNFGPVDVGSLTSLVEFTIWDFAVENLYWEQWLSLGKSSLMVRVGNQVAPALLDPFRFKDPRKSFSTGPFNFHTTIPAPTFGFGASIKWIPSEDSPWYVAGTLNDVNGDPNIMGLDWSTVSRGEFFYAGEVGYNWKRGKGDYDHLSLMVFWADERSTRNPDGPANKAGGGFSILGEKQINKLVMFAKYTYNTAEGGGGQASFSNNTATLGAVYKNLFNTSGETGIGFYFMDPIDEVFGEEARNQFGMDAFWRVLLTRNIIVTPAMRFVVNPSLNPEATFVAQPLIKFRVNI